MNNFSNSVKNNQISYLLFVFIVERVDKVISWVGTALTHLPWNLSPEGSFPLQWCGIFPLGVAEHFLIPNPQETTNFTVVPEVPSALRLIRDRTEGDALLPSSWTSIRLQCITLHYMALSNCVTFSSGSQDNDCTKRQLILWFFGVAVVYSI